MKNNILSFFLVCALLLISSCSYPSPEATYIQPDGWIIGDEVYVRTNPELEKTNSNEPTPYYLAQINGVLESKKPYQYEVYLFAYNTIVTVSDSQIIDIPHAYQDYERKSFKNGTLHVTRVEVQKPIRIYKLCSS